MESSVTFAEATTILRADVLAEASTEYYDDAALLEWLKRSARELAFTFGFPTAVAQIAVLSGDTSFSLPSNAVNIELGEVAYEGFGLSLAPYQTIGQYKARASVGAPRFYNFDPKRGDLNVYVAPPFPANGDVSVEYVQSYDTSALTSADAIWGGLFPAFHELVVYRAAGKAFDASLEGERAGYWKERETALAQEFSAFLNETPVNKLMGEEVAAS
jgi:hypothetical protein